MLYLSVSVAAVDILGGHSYINKTCLYNLHRYLYRYIKQFLCTVMQYYAQMWES